MSPETNAGNNDAAQRDPHRPIALITGATRGIGRAIAEDLSADHHILVGGTDTARTAAVVAELPSAEPFVADLQDLAAVATAVTEAGLDSLDVLVHSAGVAATGTLGQTPAQEWQRSFAVNVFAVAELTRLLLPALRAAKGQVIAINSGSGYVSRNGGGLYSATKFALRALTDALREEERGTVRVTSIHPGRVDTDMQVQLQSAMGNEDYDGSRYVAAESVAVTVRTALSMPAEAMVDELAIRPVRG